MVTLWECLTRSVLAKNMIVKMEDSSLREGRIETHLHIGKARELYEVTLPRASRPLQGAPMSTRGKCELLIP
jgi:hypothetical protein